MRRRLITVIVIVVLALLLALLILFLASSSVKSSAYGQVFVTSSSDLISTPIATAASTAQTTGGTSGLDPAIIAALIGAVALIIAALIGGAFIVYQARKTQAQNEKPGDAKPAKPTTRYTRISKRHFARAYRNALHADQHIARLQILDMNRPLEVTDIYIRVRLHQETRPGYELDTALRDVEVRHDPNELLKASRLRLESRASAAIDPDEAIRKYQRCVIVGDPGAGKTTLLKYLALKSVDNQLTDLPDLPIHVELNAFASSGYRDLLEFASSVWEKRYGFPQGEALDYMQARLQDGKVILLLDALDEAVTGTTKEASEASYKYAANAIADLATRYHQSPIVVTARKAGYHQRTRLTGFTELEVLDFRPEDIKQFVNQWFACQPDSQKQANATDLNSRLERNPRIQALAANPLLLSLIVIVYEAQLDLPDRRAELYKQCVDTLLTKWDASRDIRRRREFKPEHKRQLLEEEAWHFHLQRQRYFPENELLKVIADFLPAVGLSAEQNVQVLAEIAAENGLLKEQARGWHGFLHLTLQEYFVAQYAVDHNQLDTLLAHQGDPWWEEVILL